MPPPDYLSEVAHIFRADNVLLLCDEVRSGLGRTGRLLACQHEGVQPDELMLGKALGGGLLPRYRCFWPAGTSWMSLRRAITAAVRRKSDRCGSWAGGARHVDRERLVEHAAIVGAHLLRRLASIDNPVIREVRGRGLFAGVELHRNMAGAGMLVRRLLQVGVRPRTLRYPARYASTKAGAARNFRSLLAA